MALQPEEQALQPEEQTLLFLSIGSLTWPDCDVSTTIVPLPPASFTSCCFRWAPSHVHGHPFDLHINLHACQAPQSQCPSSH